MERIVKQENLCPHFHTWNTWQSYIAPRFPYGQSLEQIQSDSTALFQNKTKVYMLFTSGFRVYNSLPGHYTGFHSILIESSYWCVIQGIGPHFTVWICSPWWISEPMIFSSSVSFSVGSVPNLIDSPTWLCAHIYYTIDCTGSFWQLPVSFPWVAPHAWIVLMCWLGHFLTQPISTFLRIHCISQH